MTATPTSGYRGDDRLLFGIILGVLAFWLFAQTTLNIAPTMAADSNVETSVMNIAVSITALFSGIFIVVVGGLADRLGRVRIVMWGFVFSIAGSALRRYGARRHPRDSVVDAGPDLPGLVRCLHHAGQPRAHQDILGRRRSSARHQLVVHGILGRIWLRGALRRSDGPERWVAIDLLPSAVVSAG